MLFRSGCWKILPQERPTFAELLQQINAMTPLDIRPLEAPDESYQSLQQDWRQEIQDMFEELKEKEQVRTDRSLSDRCCSSISIIKGNS